MSIEDDQLRLDRAAKLKAQFVEWGDAPDVAEAKAVAAVGIKQSGVPLKDDPSATDAAAVDALVIKIIGGDISARGLLLKAVGEAEANKLVVPLGLTSITDFKNKPTAPVSGDDAKKAAERSTNPWARGNFNVTKQGALIRAIGLKKASEIAASVGSHIGATHPPRA